MNKFNPKSFEEKWRKKWEEERIYATPEKVHKDKKMNILPQLPYPSGAGLHMGHSEIYVACDIYARFKRMTDHDVLQVLGWDSFGLPAENFAIKTNVHPRVNTDKAIDNFREQIKLLGVSVDWDREVGSHNPDYYKWTQWIFKVMYEQGLAYRKEQQVNWCPNDKTVLANAQVEPDGTCERCGTKVEQKMMEQWVFKITDYAERLYEDLDKVDWPKESVARQKDWIGKSEGANVSFEIRASGDGQATKSSQKLEVFTTAHDTIYGATFMVVAPEHELIQQNKEHITNYEEVEKYVKQAANKTELERQQQKEKSGVKIKGIVAINPVNEAEIPIFVADYVLVGYGTGAIMAVPGHDERDFEFAQKYGLEIIQVVEGASEENFVSYSEDVKKDPKKYKVINSDEFDGMSYEEARPKILQKLVDLKAGEAEITYKLRDWSVSRQRFWGAPIPVVYDPEGEPHLVADEDLPVILPDDVDFKPTGESPLRYAKSFHEGVEEKYGKGWKREVDTLDTFVCSSWYFFRYLDPQNDKAFASKQALEDWAPVDFYLGGPEHVNGHLLYARFVTKVLSDAGYIDFDEPFLVHRHQGTVLGPDGRRMSKRWGNVINPTDIVGKLGADTARTYLMFMGPLEADKSWSDKAAAGVYRFISKVWELVDRVGETPASHLQKQNIQINKLIKKVGEDIENLSFNTAIAKMMEFVNFLQKEEKVDREVWKRFIIIIAPFAPYIAEELWERIGEEFSVHNQSWPSFDESMLKEESVTVGVQINGKMRGTIEISPDASEEEAVEMAKKVENVADKLTGEIKKVIYVPGRILNLIV